MRSQWGALIHEEGVTPLLWVLSLKNEAWRLSYSVNSSNVEWRSCYHKNHRKYGVHRRVKIRHGQGETLERKIINSLRNFLEGPFFCCRGEEAPFSHLRESELHMPQTASHKVPRLHYWRTKAEMKKV